ncbi:sulfatase [Hephaestia sp. GCM10023244]|uniref:sulfatase family protein n=1 Tax=unclassified Hephaestia TaxID=2631281 RepID=UPI00207739CD|nr:sulfatase [Hephaestia sp. MAHUQ-44]MCM8732452.1 sulfatase [Hephaestia sp. MAHUQ-44]
MQRRNFIKGSAAALSAASLGGAALAASTRPKRPNVVFLLTDQWRAQATAYAGDTNARTPTLDRMAAQSANCVNAISGLPLCCPARASLMTGQYALKHGVLINDVPLKPNAVTLGEAFRNAGYRTGYIGKWHLHGSPDGHYGRRDTYVPADKQFGFDYWKASECDHDYNKERYFVGNDPVPRIWPGYAPIAQTADACAYIEAARDEPDPFFLMLSLGPPHFPYQTAPMRYKQRFTEAGIDLRPNVPEPLAQRARTSLRGYYAHIAAIDDCARQLLETLEKTGLADDTIFVFTSDHGDMMFSQGLEGKLYPWDESTRIPLLIRYPRLLGKAGKKISTPINIPDLMPTLLGLAGIDIPVGIQGIDFSNLLVAGQRPGGPKSAFINNPVSNFQLLERGFDEYRGVVTERYTYVRAVEGRPWLLYDNLNDPYQKHNLVNTPEGKALLPELDAEVAMWLHRLDDDFLPGEEYLKRAGLEYYHEVKTPVGTAKSPWGDWSSTIRT